MPHGGFGGGWHGGGWHGGGWHGGYWGPGWGWYGPGWGMGTGLLSGVLIGEALSTPRAPTTVVYEQPPAPSYDPEKAMLRSELSAAQVQNQLLAAEQQKQALNSAATASVPDSSNVARVQVHVPAGIKAGERFQVQTAYGVFEATCPPNLDPTTRICIVECPTNHLTVVQGQVVTPDSSSSSQLPPPAPVHVLCVKDHLVDELDPAIAAHRIVSMRKGETGIIIEGTLDSGSPAPYSEYVAVQLDSGGRMGRVSRYVLERMESPSAVPLPRAVR